MHYDTTDYYPTPEALISKMLMRVDLDKIKTVLEPSAGKGNIVKTLRKFEENYNRRKYDIDTVEISPELRHVLKGEKIRVVHDDFMTFQTLKKYDLVIMNPPFSAADRHILKAFNMVRDGGMLVALVNAETVRNPCNNARRELLRRIAEYNGEITYIENGFACAENRANVEIAIITVKMPERQPDSFILDHMRKAHEAAPPPERDQENPLVNNNKIIAMVEHFEYEASKGLLLIDEYTALTRDMMERSPILVLTVDGDDSRADHDPHKARNLFLRNLRLKFWRKLFDAKEFSDRLTTEVLSQLHSRIDDFSNYEFSLYNIYELYIELGQNLISDIKETIVKLFEDFTARYSWAEYSSNVLHYNGWKTNDAFKINKKVIIPLYGSMTSWYADGRFHLGYDVTRKLRDIEKTFNYLAGNAAADHRDLAAVLREAEENGTRRNIRCKFFTASFFMKGTCHLVFHDEKLVQKFNVFCGQQKNWLPPGYGTVDYQEMPTEAKTVIDSFEGEQSYKRTVAQRDYYLVSDANFQKLAFTA